MQNWKKGSVFSLQLSRILITSLPYNHEGQLLGNASFCEAMQACIVAIYL